LLDEAIPKENNFKGEKMIKIKEICIGHFEYQTRRCKDCRIDGFNKRCQMYAPVYLEDYDVMEREVPIIREIDYRVFGVVGREDDAVWREDGS